MNDLDGPKLFGLPQQCPNPQLPPLATTPSESSLSPRDQQIVSSPPAFEISTTPSTSPRVSIMSRRESESSKTSTAPSDRADSLVGNMTTMSMGGRNRLPCLLGDIVGCPAVFRLSERADWYAHSLSHYGDAGPPNHALCIFCDAVFDASDPGTCWSNRMNHIAHHFETDWTMEMSRPDFRVIEDMWNKRCIPEQVYKLCFEYTERPPCDGLRPHDYIPAEIEEKQRAAYEQANRVPVRESRHEMRDRQRGKRSTGVGSKKPKSKAIVK